jgi:hypothetical protein
MLGRAWVALHVLDHGARFGGARRSGSGGVSSVVPAWVQLARSSSRSDHPRNNARLRLFGSRQHFRDIFGWGFLFKGGVSWQVISFSVASWRCSVSSK